MTEKDYNLASDASRLLAALLLIPCVLAVAWLLLANAGAVWVGAWLVTSLPMVVMLAPNRVD